MAFLLLMGIRFASHLELLQIMQLWNSCTCMLLEYTCVFMGIYLGVELLGHEICLHLTLAYNTKQFSKWFCQFTLYQPFIIVPSASLFQQHLALSVFLSLDIPLGRYYHLFVTLYCISVMTTKVKHSCKCL